MDRLRLDSLTSYGTVLGDTTNVGHEVIRNPIEYWQQQYPPHQAEDIEHGIIEVYGQLAAAKIAHSEGL